MTDTENVITDRQIEIRKLLQRVKLFRGLDGTYDEVQAKLSTYSEQELLEEFAVAKKHMVSAKANVVAYTKHLSNFISSLEGERLAVQAIREATIRKLELITDGPEVQQPVEHAAQEVVKRAIDLAGQVK